jgi:hypothetical protein
MAKLKEAHMARASAPLALGAVLLLVAAAVLMPSVASAGGYDVYACDASVAGGANNSWGAVADNGMTAYTDCPNGQGLVARNVYDNGQSPWLSGAYMIFDAPPGTVVDSISFDAGLRRHNCSWQVALIAGGADLGGTRLFGLPANQECDSWFVTPNESVYFNSRFHFGVNAPRVRIESRCGAGSCPRNGVAAIHVRNVDVRVRDDSPPALSGGRGALWTSNGWLAGTQTVGFDASDGAGIREASVAVDGRQVAQAANQCDYTQRDPCGSLSLQPDLGTAGFGGDGDHTITLTAVDAGGNPTSTSRTVHIDNSPPDAPQALTLDGGDGWRATNDFDLRWNVAPPKVGAHVAGAEWDLCTADGKTCKHGTQEGRDLTQLSDLRVPAPGEYTLKLWLRDEAGNQDPRLSAPLVRLRYDDSSPTLAFEPMRTDDPTLLAVQTSDRGSGVGSGVIEIRRQGLEQWTALPTTLAAGRLTARLDDEHLPDGAYEVRARAADLAGNERSTDRRSDGSSAAVTLPLRLRTRINAGMVQRHGRRIRFAHTAFARYGQLVRVRGKLVSPEGNPLQGVDVQVFTAVRGAGAERLIATVKASRRGGFSFLVRRGPSRAIRIRYGGTAQIQGTTRTLLLNVRARTSMRPNRRHLVNGETVTFHGRVRTGDIPAQGKLVEMQVWLRGKWRTFATTRADRRGLWKYDYRFDGTRGLQTYRFRAKLPPEAGYPFAAGGSRAVRVHVRGL